MTAGSVSLRALLERPVMHEGIRLGVPGDAVLDSESLRVVGLEVDCGDDVRRFLPLAAARIRDDHVAVGSALLLLENDQRNFYRRGSCLFGSLIGAPVSYQGNPLGELVDLMVEPDGTVQAVSAGRNGSARIYPSGDVTISALDKASAA